MLPFAGASGDSATRLPDRPAGIDVHFSAPVEAGSGVKTCAWTSREGRGGKGGEGEGRTGEGKGGGRWALLRTLKDRHPSQHKLAVAVWIAMHDLIYLIYHPLVSFWQASRVWLKGAPLRRANKGGGLFFLASLCWLGAGSLYFKSVSLCALEGHFFPNELGLEMIAERNMELHRPF